VAQQAEPPEDAASVLAGEARAVIARARWTIAGDIGRRYGAVSGDRNPIHMHALGAKAFGFPRAIAHGMWTKSRCLAALEDGPPEAFTVDVRFHKPVLIPGSVGFEANRGGDRLHFALRSPSGEELHLAGELRAGVQATAEAAQGAQR
jgi:acyl dehydratase